MKELLTVTSNLCAAFDDDGKMLPQAEVALVFSEPQYSVDTGEFLKTRAVSQVRFCSSPVQLRLLAEALTKIATGAENICLPYAKQDQPPCPK